MNKIDKARFVTPPMAWESTGDLNRLIAEAFCNHLTLRIWRSLMQRPREALQIGGPHDNFWDAVAQKCSTRGTTGNASHRV